MTYAIESTAASRLANMPIGRRQEIGTLLTRFVDTAVTATGRATFYNSKAEQAAAEQVLHDEVFGFDRGVYGAVLALPGMTDNTRQRGVLTLLGHPFEPGRSVLPLEVETALVRHLVGSLPIQRRLKLFRMLHQERVNNKRTRSLIVNTILNDPNLPWLVVKYRSGIAIALTHAWGKRRTSILWNFIHRDQPAWTPKESDLFYQHVGRYIHSGQIRLVRECLYFALGGNEGLTHPLLLAREAAKRNLTAGDKLPPEVLEGLRSVYHRDVPHATVLALTEKTHTKGQRIATQAAAQRHNVQVEMNPLDYDAARLYVYAYEQGFSPEIGQALERRAIEAGRELYGRFGNKLEVVVDTSLSMMGSGQQKWRPIAMARATADMLSKAADDVGITYTNSANGRLPDVRPNGETDLAQSLLGALRYGPDTVFVISDGYENAPVGRLAEVVAAVRQMGIETPIYHLNPVMAAESFGTRILSPQVPQLAIGNNPKSLGAGMMKLMLQEDLVRGVQALLNMALAPLSLPAAVISAPAKEELEVQYV